jgi:hypothetical protein
MVSDANRQDGCYQFAYVMDMGRMLNFRMSNKIRPISLRVRAKPNSPGSGLMFGAEGTDYERKYTAKRHAFVHDLFNLNISSDCPISLVEADG